MAAAKMSAHYTAEMMIEELRLYGQDCLKGYLDGDSTDAVINNDEILQKD